MRSPLRASDRPLRLAGAAALVGVATLASVVLGSPAASADSGAVAFTGGCGTLGSGIGARANPDASAVSVPAGAEVSFVNQLDRPATLRLDGGDPTMVAPGDAVGVAFHDGPVAATMQIDCLLGGSTGTVTVEVVPTAHPPRPTQGPSAPRAPRDGSDQAGASPGPGSSGWAGSDDPRGTTPAPGAAPAPDAGAGAGAPRAGQFPDGWNDDPQSRPPGSPAPDRSDRSSGDERASRWGDPDGGDDLAGPATVDEQAAEQMARTAESAPDNGPIGLLALIATVCVAGTAAGAVRAIAIQRAS